MQSGAKRKRRGDGMVGHIIVITLVALLCVPAAAYLGQAVIALIVGSDGTGGVGGVTTDTGAKVDNIQITDPEEPPANEEEE